jgi:hypothetical protein
LEWYECPVCGAVHSGPTLVIDEPGETPMGTDFSETRHE